ncbi:MAG: DUF1992 domain-containing protein [Acidobacteria bacterium]|nr:DUF1992 domain-containing protein [Acidobacteriota bacterium]
MDAWHLIADRKIVEAQDEGLFDHLKGAGEPLSMDDHVPESLRMAYTILKNAHVLPPEIELKHQIEHLTALIASCGREAGDLPRQLQYKQMQLQMLLERRGCTLGHYGMAVMDRVGKST